MNNITTTQLNSYARLVDLSIRRFIGGRQDRKATSEVEAIRQEQRAELAKAEAMRQEAARQEKRRLEEDSDEEEPVRKKMKTVTIVLDNTKLIYLGIMIVILIMVLKK